MAVNEDIQKVKRSSNKSLIVFLSMVIILVSILLFTLFLFYSFRMSLAEQAKENVYSEDTNLLSAMSLYLKKMEYSLMETKLTASNLIGNSNEQELLKNYINGKIKLDNDVQKISISSNDDSANAQSLWFLNAKKFNGRVSFTLPYEDPLSGKILIDFSTNIYDSDGQDIGAVAHSFYLDRLTRELQKRKTSSGHEIYLLDYSKNLIASTEQESVGDESILDFNKIGLGKYKDKIFAHSNLFIVDSDFYIFFTPVHDRNFVLISKTPIRPFYTTESFFFNRTFIIPISVFVIIITLVSIYVILLMGTEQRKKEKIELESLTDPLTKVYNRRYFENAIKQEFIIMSTEKAPISLIMLDLDFFKKCNDTYGHTHGDEILKSVANVFIKYTRRQEDFVARLGGEEFGMLLVGTNIESAVKIAENVRKDVELTKIQIKDLNKEVFVTISAGVASIVPQDDNFQELYDMADKMLYKAKQSGRNRVCY
jgi:diguanylate cyclase (GGDEF)-like protein